MAHKGISRRFAAVAVTLGLVLSGGVLSTTAQAAPVQPTNIVPSKIVEPTDPQCAGAKEFTFYNFTDFHGRLNTAAQLFTPPLQAKRDAADDDARSRIFITSSGDMIGGSTFTSFSQKDLPSMEVMAAGGLDVYAVGNHEFDYGLDYLTDIVIPTINAPALANNATLLDGSPITGVEPFLYQEVDGANVAIIGSTVERVETTTNAKGMTSTDPWAAINDTVEYVTSGANDLDGLPGNDKATLVVVLIHEGVASIPANIHPEVDLIFGGHTHVVISNIQHGVPVVQAGEYGKYLAEVKFDLSAEGNMCGAPEVNMIQLKKDEDKGIPGVEADNTIPQIAQIEQIVDEANAQADIIGAQVIGNSTAPITRSFIEDSENRGGESTATDMVAQFLYDTLSNGDPEFIGIQNPGGTRADIDAGEITYKEAAEVLPFANMLKTADIKGSDFKMVLEEQWQYNPSDPDASFKRPYLQMGLSDNITVTYDESLPHGSRITSIYIDGQPLDPDKYYRIGAGNFLIDEGKTTGPDNFWSLMKVTNVVDSGRVDLEAWVDWIRNTQGGVLTPSYDRRFISVSPLPTTLYTDQTISFTVGQPMGEEPVAKDTLNMFSKEVPSATELAAALFFPFKVDGIAEAGEIIVLGTAPVTDGVATMTLQAPEAPCGTPAMTYEAELIVIEETTETSFQVPVTVEVAATAACPADKVPSKKLPKTGI